MDNMLQAALNWHSQGFCPIPLRPGTKRKPLVRWTELRDAEILPSRRWVFDQFQGKKNMALLVGSYGNLVVLDFDCMDALHCYEQINPELARTYRIATSRGRHLYFKISGGYPRKTFGFKCFLDGHGGNGVVGEYKASGFVVAAGRHPSGAVYKAINPDAPVMEVDNARRILKGMRGPGDQNINKYIMGLMEVETAKPTTPIRQGAQSALQSGDGLITQIKANLNIVQMLAPHTKLRKLGDGRWFSGLCFMHDDHHPSLWADAVKQRVGCHASGCKLNIKSWDAIDLFAWANKCSTQQAITELGKQLSIIKPKGAWLKEIFGG